MLMRGGKGKQAAAPVGILLPFWGPWCSAIVGSTALLMCGYWGIGVWKSLYFGMANVSGNVYNFT
jgi:hypothetical protein